MSKLWVWVRRIWTRNWYRTRHGGWAAACLLWWWRTGSWWRAGWFKGKLIQLSIYLTFSIQIILRTTPHPVFERGGDDLYTNMTISLEVKLKSSFFRNVIWIIKDALTGFKGTLKHLDGRIVSVERSKVTWPGFKQRIRHGGMPSRTTGHFGSLIITFDIVFPQGQFSSGETELLKKILYSSAEPLSYNGF